jgi:hypothetical protein
LSGKHPRLEQSNKLNEKSVHPAVPEFGCQESQLVACRINEENSRNKMVLGDIIGNDRSSASVNI